MNDPIIHGAEREATVIIATRNNARLLEQTLDALLAQDVDALDWEIIVADNGSTDDTADVARRAAERHPVVHVLEPRPGQNRARNAALRDARGRLVVFTDDDVIPHRGWLAALTAAAERWPDDAVFGGQIHPRFPVDAPEWACDPEFCNGGVAFSRYVLAQAEGPTRHAPFSPNFAVRREVFEHATFNEAIGPAGGDYAMGSETEFLQRLADAGHRFIYVPQAEVEHIVRPEQLELKALLYRFYRYGRGRVRRGMYQRSKRFCGVPRRAWRQLPGALWRHGCALFKDERERFATGKELYFLWGAIREHRRMAREATEPAAAARPAEPQASLPTRQ